MCKAFTPSDSSRNLDYESYPRDDSWREMFSRFMMAKFQGTTPVSEPIDTMSSLRVMQYNTCNVCGIE